MYIRALDFYGSVVLPTFGQLLRSTTAIDLPVEPNLSFPFVAILSHRPGVNLHQESMARRDF
jgi:hypothetical protein